MPDITVEPAALRAAAARIEQVLGTLEVARDRLPGAALGPPPGLATGGPDLGGPDLGGPDPGGRGGGGPGTNGPRGGGPGIGGPRSGLLRRGYGELLADQHHVLTGLAVELHADADRLRRVADRYEDTECQNTTEIR
jgi:hypothetical protein